MNQADFIALKGVFIAENEDSLQLLEKNILGLENNVPIQERLELVKEMFRSAHSMKGSALMFGFANLSQAAHRLEDSFAILRDRANLATVNHEVVTMLLSGVDCLRKIIHQINTEEHDDRIQEELAAIAAIKSYLESIYGNEEKPKLSPLQQSSNPATLKIIFERELPPVFERLEAELSQANQNNLPKVLAAINKIYFQLSGVAGMLQLPDFAAIAESLRGLIDDSEMTLENFQLIGWAIAQNLRTAQQQILQDQPIQVEPLPTPHVSNKLNNNLNNNNLDNSSANSANQTEENYPPILGEYSAEKLAIVVPEKPHIPVATSASSSLSPSVQRPTIRVDLETLTELIDLMGELVINRTNLERQENLLRGEIKRLRRGIFDLNQSGGQLREEYDRLSVRRNPQPSLPDFPSVLNHNYVSFKKKTGKYYHFDPLELDEYSEFHTTAQRVIETSQAIAASSAKIDDLGGQFERSIDQLRRITNSLRSRIMQLRVVPFSTVVDRLPRAIRDLCRTYNKEVNLVLLGRDTKVDKSLLDALRDPLVHLVRNAFDHGIESPEVRKAAGKPPTGQIEIEACHQGGQTIITVSDDGRGIDPELIRQKVVKRGVLSHEQAADLSIAELYDFLFWPGFSTADQVTELSGRGVGLDVVRDNLRQVRGTVKVDSRPGKGTTFMIKLPLLLSITDALLVNLDNHTLAVPLDTVEEIIKLQPEEIHIAGDRPMICWRDEFIRLVRLADLLPYHSPYPDQISPKREQDFIPVLVLNSSEGILAVIVDYLAGQQEIVVKALPAPLSKPKGAIGSTILGDGRVVTIIDVDDLIENFQPHNNGAIAVSDYDPPKLLQPPQQAPKILVVDDSYTLRQLVALSLSRARYRVEQAKDGLDAIHQLERGLQCDLMIVDIEMPRMDGFELLRSLKNHPSWATIPVVMLTSRSGQKHRQLAAELGAIDYLTKPYNEAKFLDKIANILAHK
jgi:chemosensory pili system protein ChpA (sensor histidine kinase/response regulator)